MRIRGRRPFHSPERRKIRVCVRFEQSSSTLTGESYSSYCIGQTETFAIVQLGDDRISRMADNSTENTGNVAGDERHTELLGIRALLARLGHDVFVQGFDRSFETGEFHHRVRNLTKP